MIDERMERLMHDVLDGSATAEQAARLDAWLAEHPEARARQREIQAMFASLDRVPMVDAPQDLTARVLAALPASAARDGSATRDASPWPFRRRALAFGVPVALGLALGIAVWMGRHPEIGDGERGWTAAEMAPPGARRAEALHLGTARASAAAWTDGGLTRVSLDLHGDATARLEMTFAAESVEVVSVERAGADAGDAYTGPGLVRLTSSARGARWIATLRPTPGAQVVVTLRLADQAVRTFVDVTGPLGPGAQP
ncbi:MAG TPA: hypothetical protein VL332_07830 [Candidatus Saccharimonadaceae bacterium]|jgi:anti-sigma factor RsiW|nr:hypothetical protein [Candidatus Saccharimonadaceae bacterium]